MVLGLLAAVTWGSGDFGGGILSRRVPLFGVVGVSQLVGMAAAIMLATARGEPFPAATDIAWATGAGVCGVVGVTGLYRGLAVGRMGVVAPTTGVLGAVLPVAFGFAVQGVPQPAAIVGIVGAILAVVVVTSAPGHGTDRPSGIRWALLAGLAIGGFNICIGQFSGASAFGQLAIIRIVQAIMISILIVAWRQPWRVPRDVLPKLMVIGLLDMTGNAAFILAVQAGALAIATVLSSLYPVVTVILAIVLLREHLSRSHVVGIVLTVFSIALISIGSAT